jgi:putative transposase
MFNSLAEVRCLSEQWRIDYNQDRPHKSLGYHSPWSYADQWLKKKDSEPEFYPQTATENHPQIEGRRLVDKAAKNE